MIHPTISEKGVRAERSHLELTLEQVFKATPLYVFFHGLVAAFRDRRR